MPLLLVTERRRTAPLHFCALLCHSFAIPSTTALCLASAALCTTPPCLCFAMLISAFPLLFLAHQGDSFRCPAIACHCFSILRLHYAKRLPAAPFQRYASLRFSFALPRYASPREASAVLLVPKQNSAYPMQFLAVRRSASPLLCFAKLSLSSPLLGEAGLGAAVAMLLKSSQLLRRSRPSHAVLSHCPVRRAY